MTNVFKQRIQSIDLLRGAIMIIMALDHVRDYFHKGNFLFNPLDLNKTTAPIFLTRWVTHFCAPVFMLLAGTAAFLIGQKKTKKELSIFLLKRGLWLVFLELVIVNFGWDFNIRFPFILFVTIWALGISMITLAALIQLPFKFILVFGIVLVFGHNLFDNVNVQGNSIEAFGWSILHKQQYFNFFGEGFLVGYPIIPWIGVMPLGYCIGKFYTVDFDPIKRKKYLLTLGYSAAILFIALRFSNLYGDPSKWEVQKNSLFTLLSFINVTKYPPSLLYLLLTLGTSMIFLAYSEKFSGKLVDMITVYGRVPMFFYLIHIYLIHLLAMIASSLFTKVGWQNWILKQPLWFNSDLTGYGFSLTVVYIVWVVIIIALFPLCKRYDRYKQTHKEKWWLSYL